MDYREKALAREFFKLKIHESNGQSFEDLFCSIMEFSDKDFRKVKPQGKFGDRKNDGFIPDKGKYYQVYAPENTTNNPSLAIKKLDVDLSGLITFWKNENSFIINEFYFVFNDKYHGAYPGIYTETKKLKAKYNLSVCDVILSKNVEDILLKLEPDKIISIVGYFPREDEVPDIDFNILSQIVNHIVKSTNNFTANLSKEAPDFDHKIEFNGLGKAIAVHLTVGSYSYGDVEDYFSKNSSYARSTVQQRLSDMYRELNKSKVLSDIPKNDIPDFIFKKMIDMLTPDNLTSYQTKNFQNNLLAIMAYFFESCDIFEEPLKDKEVAC